MAGDPAAPVSPLTVFDDLYVRDAASDVIIPDGSSSGSGSGSSDIPTPVTHTHVSDRLYGWTDSSASPVTVYTTSVALSTGMTLYGETGANTGKAVGTINQDGSFEVSSNWQLTVIQQADSIDGTLEIYSDSEKTNVIGSITFPTRRPSSPVSQSIVISGYNTIWVESVGEGGEYGMENVSITGGTFVPDTELYHMYLGGSITRESDSVVFSYYED